ncbi:MAG: DUF2975 domain-containing protein, partial [Stackebrandtia sp.]
MASGKRNNWLKEFQIGIGIVTAVLIGLTLFYLGATIVDMASRDTASSPVTVSVPAEYSQVMAEPGPGLNDRAELASSADVEVEVIDPTPGEYALYLLTWLPTACVTIAVAAMLFALVKRARRTDPFTARTVRRLRAIGLVVLIGGTLTGFGAMVANYQLSS